MAAIANTSHAPSRRQRVGGEGPAAERGRGEGVFGEAAGRRLQVGPGGAALADGGFDFEGVLPGEVELADEFLAGIGCGGWTSSRRWQDPVCGEGQQRQAVEEQPDDDQQHLGHTPHDRHI